MTPELEQRARIVFDHLKKAYELGRVTPEHRITSAKMVAVYCAPPFGWEIGGEQIREMVSWLNENKFPICSNSSGYTYSESPDDVRATANHLISRARALESRAKMMIELATDMQKRINQLFDNRENDPKLQSLNENFGLEEVRK